MEKSNRLYFTDPIKALFMMREHGVEFECKNSDEEMQEFNLGEDEGFYPFGEVSLQEPYSIEDLLAELGDLRTIYVTKESEKIFKIKKGDTITHSTSRHDKNSSGLHFCYEIPSLVWINRYFDKIIMRHGKHFLAAENEK